ncbi:UDP-N-acetylmuramate dehydrogenase [Pillotina sp. SPG140]
MQLSTRLYNTYGKAIVLRFYEPMSQHTTFKVGGPADIWIQPDSEHFLDYAKSLIKGNIPFFVLGGGSNIVVSDKGIRGTVLDTTQWGSCFVEGTDMIFRSGTRIAEAVELAAQHNLGGLAFLAGMPGTVGGAVWMNARCYGHAIAEFLETVTIIDENAALCTIPYNPQEYGYKKSPFQQRPVIIVEVRVHLYSQKEEDIRKEMLCHTHDRSIKGHYRFPCAGSVFKNNKDFSKPTGQIIEELGLCGLRIGGAQVADYHGNIIINTGTATATDIQSLVEYLMEQVYKRTGFRLEPEICFIGG